MVKSPTGGVVKLDNTPPVNPNNFATKNDISTLSTKATTFYNKAITLMPSTLVATGLSNIPNTGTVLLKNYIISKTTPDPIITGNPTIQNTNFNTYTIVNYDTTSTYNITSTIGTVVNNNDGTFTVTANNSAVGDVKDIVVTSGIRGKLLSNVVTMSITITT